MVMIADVKCSTELSQRLSTEVGAEPAAIT
jgi:hypothetical protein